MWKNCLYEPFENHNDEAICNIRRGLDELQLQFFLTEVASEDKAKYSMRQYGKWFLIWERLYIENVTMSTRKITPNKIDKNKYAHVVYRNHVECYHPN